MFKSWKIQILWNHILQFWITEQSENYFNFAILQISRVGMQHLIFVIWLFSQSCHKKITNYQPSAQCFWYYNISLHFFLTHKRVVSASATSSAVVWKRVFAILVLVSVRSDRYFWWKSLVKLFNVRIFILIKVIY